MSETATPIRICLLGHFEVACGEHVLCAPAWSRRKAAALLQRLAMERRLVKDQAIEFLVSALLLLLLPVPPGRPVSTRGWSGFVADAREGLHYARHNRLVSRLVLVQGMGSLSVGATSALLVILAQRHYQLPPGGFGTFILAIGVGALVGPFLLGLLVKEYLKSHWLFGPYVIRRIGDVFLAVATAAPIAWLLLFIYGLNTSSGMAIYQTWVQRRIPDAMRGRVLRGWMLSGM
jgi:predicted MFS family arabinose efflux permease